jgi:hypothetical protein
MLTAIAVAEGVVDAGEWYPIKSKPGATGSHYVDWSRLLDAPAGKHGFLTAKDGNLYFGDGTPARLWGVSVEGRDVFASNSRIDSAVSRLARMGCNMLRVRRLDAVSKESMRQLDYLIYRCKGRGIYIFLEFLGNRDIPPDFGLAQAEFFSRKLIGLQKERIANLLNRVNEFTGVAYKDEPAIAASELISHATIFATASGDALPPDYRKELEEIWEDKLLTMEAEKPASAKRNTMKPAAKKSSPARQPASKSASAKAEYAKFQSAYGGAAARPEPETAEPDVGPSGFAKLEPVTFINLASAYKSLAVFGLDWKDGRARLRLNSDSGDAAESIKFLSDLEMGYFREMRGHFRESGGKYALAGSDMPLPLLAMLRDNAELDIVCASNYSTPFPSQLKNLRSSAIVAAAYYRVANRPFILTGWDHGCLDVYVPEAVPLMAAYGALQGWHGILQFNSDESGIDTSRAQSGISLMRPEDAAQWVMAAPLFLRGDVKTAPNAVIEGVMEERYGNLPNYSDVLENNYHLPFITRVAKSFDRGTSANANQFDKYYDRAGGVIASETGELAINVNEKRGYMRIDAPRVAGVSGFIGGNGERHDFPSFRCELSNKQASIFAVSADGANLVSSKRFYIVAMGLSKMRGQGYGGLLDETESADGGEALTEVLNGKITFKKTGGNKLQVFPLEADGARGKAIEVKSAKGALGELDLSSGRTPVYEVEAVKQGWVERVMEFFRGK